MMNRRTSANHAKMLALSAMLTALSLALLYMAALVPSGRMGLTAAAGLFPAAAVVSYGLPAGFLCYGGTAILALLLLTDKGLAMLYVFFFGLYPLVKGIVERMRRLPLELLLKLLFFNGVFSLALFGFSALFFSLVPWEGLPVGGLYLAGNAVFLLYDFGFSKLICFYRERVDRVLRKT